MCQDFLYGTSACAVKTLSILQQCHPLDGLRHFSSQNHTCPLLHSSPYNSSHTSLGLGGHSTHSRSRSLLQVLFPSAMSGWNCCCCCCCLPLAQKEALFPSTAAADPATAIAANLSILLSLNHIVLHPASSPGKAGDTAKTRLISPKLLSYSSYILFVPLLIYTWHSLADIHMASSIWMSLCTSAPGCMLTVAPHTD